MSREGSVGSSVSGDARSELEGSSLNKRESRVMI